MNKTNRRKPSFLRYDWWASLLWLIRTRSENKTAGVTRGMLNKAFVVARGIDWLTDRHPHYALTHIIGANSYCILTSRQADRPALCQSSFSLLKRGQYSPKLCRTLSLLFNESIPHWNDTLIREFVQGTSSAAVKSGCRGGLRWIAVAWLWGWLHCKGYSFP